MCFENKFRLTVNNGTGSGLYDYGENTTINATIPNPIVSSYTDNRTFKVTKPAANGWYSYGGSLSFSYKQPNATGYSGAWTTLNKDGTVSDFFVLFN